MPHAWVIGQYSWISLSRTRLSRTLHYLELKPIPLVFQSFTIGYLELPAISNCFLFPLSVRDSGRFNCTSSSSYWTIAIKWVPFLMDLLLIIILLYSGTPISQTHDFSKTPITWSNSCFPWICSTVILSTIFWTPDFTNQFSFPLEVRENSYDIIIGNRPLCYPIRFIVILVLSGFLHIIPVQVRTVQVLCLFTLSQYCIFIWKS